jgi:hypothetical protein
LSSQRTTVAPSATEPLIGLYAAPRYKYALPSVMGLQFGLGAQYVEYEDFTASFRTRTEGTAKKFFTAPKSQTYATSL